ncbi:MAG: alcohol dehydrogenase [Ancylobacter novellus]|uniref:Alcohol dehydrogenase n=1 Tax=Ancylobacter novellus TaxID=921 RepID=A0A2W5MEW6_ANCNO|nr:MAG: alcohol dehydrogenase [Ancylobacter novellus]
MKALLRLIGGLVLVAVVAAAGFAGWRFATSDADVSAADVKPTPDLLERGRYLTAAADCAACHTTPGGKPFAGGVAFELPFGTIYSTNITADQNTGIGSWSDDDFVRSLHKGVGKDGRNLYPAFPYTSYTGLSRDDAVAIKAYLFSLPKENAPARENTLSFPFNQRWAMTFWNVAFLDQKRFRPDPKLTDAENRGAYLATALGHCGECHTPRNLAFALSGREFAGAEIRGWRAYNITPDKEHGVGDWTDGQLASYLATGHAEGRGAASGPMAEVIVNSTRLLSKDDVAALVAYMRKVEPRKGDDGVRVAEAPKSMLASTAWAAAPSGAENGLGARVFQGACASCHQWSGKGQQTPYAALAGTRAVSDPEGVNLVQVLLEGSDLRAVHQAAWMPKFADAYTDAELAAVANYVIAHFGGKEGKVTPAQVAGRRSGK